MSKFTLYLLFFAIVFTTAKYVYHLNFELYLTSISQTIETKLIKSLLLTISVVFGIYFLIITFITKECEEPAHFYADQISKKEYEVQKHSYTQKKLAELFNTKEYQNFIRQKSGLKTQSFQDSDEEF